MAEAGHCVMGARSGVAGQTLSLTAEPKDQGRVAMTSINQTSPLLPPHWFHRFGVVVVVGFAACDRAGVSAGSARI
jgi:hypothetical protein